MKGTLRGLHSPRAQPASAHAHSLTGASLHVLSRTGHAGRLSAQATHGSWLGCVFGVVPRMSACQPSEAGRQGSRALALVLPALTSPHASARSFWAVQPYTPFGGFAALHGVQGLPLTACARMRWRSSQNGLATPTHFRASNFGSSSPATRLLLASAGHFAPCPQAKPACAHAALCLLPPPPAPGSLPGLP